MMLILTIMLPMMSYGLAGPGESEEHWREVVELHWTHSRPTPDHRHHLLRQQRQRCDLFALFYPLDIVLQCLMIMAMMYCRNMCQCRHSDFIVKLRNAKAGTCLKEEEGGKDMEEKFQEV